MDERSKRERPDPQRSLVGFNVAGVAYAIPIGSVREVINPIELTDLPCAPAAVAGVAEHRGQVITVIDLRRQWSKTPSSNTASSNTASSNTASSNTASVAMQRAKWIVVDAGEVPIGLVVDQVTGVFGTGGQPLQDPPKVSGDEARGFLGVLSRNQRLTYVLDVSRLDSFTLPGPAPALPEAALGATPERRQ